MLFFHKILNVSSLNFNFEVRITTHFARISYIACKQRILKRGTREGNWTRNVQAPRSLMVAMLRLMQLLHNNITHILDIVL